MCGCCSAACTCHPSAAAVVVVVAALLCCCVWLSVHKTYPSREIDALQQQLWQQLAIANKKWGRWRCGEKERGILMEVTSDKILSHSLKGRTLLGIHTCIQHILSKLSSWLILFKVLISSLFLNCPINRTLVCPVLAYSTPFIHTLAPFWDLIQSTPFIHALAPYWDLIQSNLIWSNLI